MIVGLLIRNFKIYQNINYIPLSKGKFFSAVVGENGAGKSSILEALNSFFNGVDWNYNHTVIANGFDAREPFICPIFMLSKDGFPAFKYKHVLEYLSCMAWECTKEGFNAAHRKVADQFCRHRDLLIDEGFGPDTHYLLPFGIRKNTASATEYFYSIFEPLEDDFGEKLFADVDQEKSDSFYQLICDLHKFVYLPSEIDFQTYTKIEGRTIQALLGRKLNEIVREFIKKDTVTEINKNLTGFLTDIASALDGYEYKKPAKKQNLFNHSHFTEKVIEAFFESKVLTKITDGESTPVNNLSSGEKRKAIIDVARGFLIRGDLGSNQQVILGIDEPELSLHVSSCFEQFEKIREISESNVQTIITTHWYGFMPVVSNGVAVYIPKGRAEIPLIDLRCFREDISRLKVRTSGALPTNIELKSINDLVQSIIASITGADYRWVVCEGSSDKIYLDHFFSGHSRRPYILPVGAAKNVKKIYNYICMALDTDKDDIQGRVIFLLDTDKKFEKFESNDSIPAIRMRRFLNNISEGVPSLLTTTSSDFYPPTEIEDVLNAECFLEALMTFKDDDSLRPLFGEFSEKLNVQNVNQPSGLAMNLRESDKGVLERIFDEPKFKIRFALKYVEISNEACFNPPGWVGEVETFLYPPLKKARKKSAVGISEL